MFDKKFLAPLVVALTITGTLLAQDKSQRPSPPAKAEATIAGKKVTIDYSSPRMRGRKIFGDLVPYGQVWRAGANEATTLKTDGNLVIGGTRVPAGGYTVFTLPSATGWKLIINRQTGQWGTDYDKTKDFARIDMKTSPTSAPVENFTISFDKDNNLVMEWENTRASVDVKPAQ